VTPRLPAHLKFLRGILQRLNYHFTADPLTQPEPFDPALVARAEKALREMPLESEGARAYLEVHIPRLARTIALAPPPQKTGRVLELGCYMQITPLLQRICGYKEVRGAYFGPVGRVDRKSMQFPDGEFTCQVDHFNAERDPFPYPAGHFDLVVAGEIIEHMAFDPMHLLVESHRVLIDGGYILVTTPNIASIASVGKALDGRYSPMIYPNSYKPTGPGIEEEIGHVREYTLNELTIVVNSAGFEIVQAFTTHIEEHAGHKPLLKFLAANGYSTENRGEQSWCLARKRADLPVDRYPIWIYYPNS